VSEAGSRPKIRWIVALVGMLVVPIGGLVWAAVGGGGGSPSSETIEAEDGADVASDGETDEGATTKSGTKKKKKKKSKSKSASRSGGRKATHEAAACCEALRKAGSEDPEVSNRPTYLAAAASCESSPTAKRALSSVRSIVEGSRHELPSECKEDE